MDTWFEELVPRIRTSRQYLSDKEIIKKYKKEKYRSEDIFLAIHAAKILDGI